MTQQASKRVIIRSYQSEDFEALTRIDQGIWWAGAQPHTDARKAQETSGDTPSPWTNLPAELAQLDMLHSLGRSTHALVAVAAEDGYGEDMRGEEGVSAQSVAPAPAPGTALGAMLINITGHAEPWRHACAAAAAPIRAAIAGRPEGTALLDALDADGRSIDTLSARSASGYPAEVVLFMLAPQARGLGLGRRLFDAGLDLMHGAGADRYFLYTDTTCTYTFYEHRGLRRIGEATGLRDMFGAPIDRFIYAGPTRPTRPTGPATQTATEVPARPAATSTPAVPASGTEVAR